MRAPAAFAVVLAFAAVACMPPPRVPASPPAMPTAVVARTMPALLQPAAAPTYVPVAAPISAPTYVPAATPTRFAVVTVPIARATPVPVPVVSIEWQADGILPDANDAYGVVLEDLGSGARLAVNDQRVFPSASLYKLGVAWTVLRKIDAGAMSLDESLPIEPEDAVEGEPYGGVAAGDSPSVAEALGVMLTISSNAAAHALLRTVGRHEFNVEMERIGLSQTRVPEDVLDDGTDGEEMAVTSAADIAHLLRLVATTQELSAAARSDLEQWLANVAPPDPLRETLPEGVDLLDKTGNLEDASNIGALLLAPNSGAIVVVLDQGVDPGEARGVIARFGHAAYDAVLQHD